ncbi:ubiquitin carboxyl-terminal hydrolase [Musa troglodytarum]|uniref:Ubiquitin carboxyl-terminal hydrolase n=1 Tax=Musa troglodytarum TaxID=320322 RepID=A0A9E7HQQ4_9LILI|nr:ubiquitin carboxyl-terminal hydrolase [Musa troglodytarum]
MKHKEVNVYHLIHKVKHGYKILSANKALNLSQYHIVASILGIGIGMTGLYMALQESNIGSLYLPRMTGGKDSSEIIYVAGLKNLGNNCFLNVILQALASCSCFVSFLRNLLVMDVESIEEYMPLLVALTTLLEDLCIIHDERTILDPRKVMLALSFYVSSFKLTRQQDAAEAFLHLLCSLEEEVSQCYAPHGSSLAEITGLTSRIHKPKSKSHRDYEQWRRYIYGPFDGTVGSILTCRSCSSVLSVDIEHFRSLSLSPALDGNADIMEGCSIIECLERFTALEHLENFRCGRCWHIGALKYLSIRVDKDEEKIDKLSHCVNLDCCDCKSLFHQEEIKWTGFSCALKQLSLTRCPKILCIHLQRASMNDNGDLIKLQGHISFPFILDLFPFTKARKILAEEFPVQCTQSNVKRQQQLLDPRLIQINMEYKKQFLGHVYGTGRENLLHGFPMNSFRRSSDELKSDDSSAETIIKDKVKVAEVQAREASTSYSTSFMYLLTSVVEHYGRSGSGHYAAYRRVTSKSGAGNSMGTQVTEQSRWFYVSDHEISDVSEESVLSAEASLLFYERIDGGFYTVT